MQPSTCVRPMQVVLPSKQFNADTAKRVIAEENCTVYFGDAAPGDGMRTGNAMDLWKQAAPAGV